MSSFRSSNCWRYSKGHSHCWHHGRELWKRVSLASQSAVGLGWKSGVWDQRPDIYLGKQMSDWASSWPFFPLAMHGRFLPIPQFHVKFWDLASYLLLIRGHCLMAPLWAVSQIKRKFSKTESWRPWHGASKFCLSYRWRLLIFWVLISSSFFI